MKRIKDKLYPLKQWLYSIFVFPSLGKLDESYDNYWQKRKIENQRDLNSFQKSRAKFVLKLISPQSIATDIGCGNGDFLNFINQKKPMKKLVGVDISPKALEIASQKGIETIKLNINEVGNLKILPKSDFIFLFEILEHLPNPELLLQWAVNFADKGVFFSVPNTGFFTHRLRLLFGRFPLQWRVHPSEHIRFWTVKDMKWWLKELGYKNYIMEVYEGMSVLNFIWPSLFGQGILVYIPIRSF